MEHAVFGGNQRKYPMRFLQESFVRSSSSTAPWHMLTYCPSLRGATSLPADRAAQTVQQVLPKLTRRTPTASYRRLWSASGTGRTAATREQTEPVQETGSPSEALGSIEAHVCEGVGTTMDGLTAELNSSDFVSSASQLRPRKTALSALDEVGRWKLPTCCLL